MTVIIHVSKPYVLIAGGWSGMRPAGRKRTYRANVLGRDFANTSKAAIQSTIRAAIYREEVAAGFLHVPVRFEFVEDGE